jgi:hypothetical protein
MNAIRRKRKAEEVRKHNEAYAAEKARWESMTRDQQIRELVEKGVKAGIQQVKKYLGFLTAHQRRGE